MAWRELWVTIRRGHERGKRLQRGRPGVRWGEIDAVAVIPWFLLSPVLLLALAVDQHSPILAGLLVILYFSLASYGYHTVLGVLQ